MGRIKSTLVKRTAKELMRQMEFTEAFDQNKKHLHNTMPSKKIRNKIAGYISRLQRKKTLEQKKLHAQI